MRITARTAHARTLTTLGTAAVLAMGLVACGGDDGDGADGGDGGEDSVALVDRDPQEIMDLAERATLGADSVQLTGTITQDGVETTIDGRLGGADACEITLTVDGATVEVLGVDGEYWMKPDATFWTQQGGPSGAQVAELVGDRWVVDPEGSFAELCDVKTLLGSEDDDGDEPEYTGAEETTRDGEDVVEVSIEDEEGDGSAFVRADEPHYVVAIVREGENEGEMTFSEFDEEFEVEAPAAADQVDLQDLG
ncbi:hypothetical protein RDV89_19805 [Nocardioides zeae]|uniref:Lipoprotein n=1 Tax=Nocardioides imazamoxiresistens TaxID=3231893 RepID=A0ABU3Q1G3_9ACTN|nr:hypothetical protein [Nocardioides zeae]MDT9595343.1 hypothetical protein [Nocardioides zeae]